MTHLSDFSYCERGIQSMFVLGWVLHQLWHADRFASLSPARLLKANLKTMTAYMLLLSQVSIVLYDLIATSFKYEEGFYDDPTRGIIQQPSSRFSEASKTKVAICGQLINLSFTMQSSGLFLLLAYINSFISSTMKMQAKSSSGNSGQLSSLMSQTENKMVMVYSASSIFVYPILTQLFTGLLSVVMPQVLFHVENLILVAITLVTNKRMDAMMKKFLYSADGAAENPAAIAIKKIIFYNNCLCVSLLSEAFGLGVINIDILNFKFWGGSPFIYASKFLTDFWTVFFSFGISTACLGPFGILTQSAKNEYSRSNASKKVAVSNSTATPSSVAE